MTAKVSTDNKLQSESKSTGKVTREETIRAILEDMTSSQMKSILSKLDLKFKKKSKRPDLIELLVSHPNVTTDFLMKEKEDVDVKSSSERSRSSSQVSTPGRRKRSTSTSRNKTKSSPAKKPTSAAKQKPNVPSDGGKSESSTANNVENGHCVTSAKDSPSKSRKNTKHSAKLKQMSELKKLEEESAELVLWRRPLSTLWYFGWDCVDKSKDLFRYFWTHKISFLLILLFSGLIFALDYFSGPHQVVFKPLKENFNWCVYWIILGILSSVGLGTGLHTFLLYLGPHIASVTLAAFECNSVDFPNPPYPKEINCPDISGVDTPMTIWKILSKVRLEAFMWGLGTALGELPPYFMARAARLSGTQDLDAELVELNELKKLSETNPEKVPFTVRCKLQVEKLIEKVGFPGILLMASIPNPLFDLAGITCGYLLVPFWQFFGATAIGKAIVKMHIQKLFVIMSFSEHHAEHFVMLIGKVPYLGPKMQAPFQEFFANQKEKLHRKAGQGPVVTKQSWLSWVFDKLVLAMVLYFVVSIVNSMAQSCYKRVQEGRLTTEKKETKRKVKSN
ncbi:vacuole membrane protein 1-like [Convolutriloba macropyga]|uniref:vacuole membrane protein 1-like n=1 Tax=Convolutriloba macropyga TaxID=536237 RepID=UPI003F51F820